MDLVVMLPLVVVFASVAIAAAAVMWLLTDPQLAERRLSTVTAGSTPAAVRQPLLGDRIPKAVQRIRSFVPKSPKAMNRIERLMASAGHHGPWPATIFGAAQLAVPIAFFGTVVWLFGSDGVVLLFAVIAGMIGYFVPTLWLGRSIEKRRREIQNGLPDAIDLMIVCIESGSGIDQALKRVAEELALPYPALAAELEMISAETRAGKPRLEAFKNFASRTKVEDVRSLVAMLIQTDRFGTSIGMALRTHAETSRTKRRQRAEEKAAKLAVKLLFPLIFCLFPAFYVVVLGPSMLNIFRHFVYGGLGG
jgi:tight adherence protein C